MRRGVKCILKASYNETVTEKSDTPFMKYNIIHNVVLITTTDGSKRDERPNRCEREFEKPKIKEEKTENKHPGERVYTRWNRDCKRFVSKTLYVSGVV